MSAVPVLAEPTQLVTKLPDEVALEQYILKAEVDIIDRPGKQYARKKVFVRGPTNASIPLLRRDRVNRIIFFAGKFNPPHRGHRELLLNGYLSTDGKTIAAMIVPVIRTSESEIIQTPNRLQGKSLKLTHKERTCLWKDDLLRRFSWVFPGNHSESEAFIARLCAITLKDGFKVEFAALGGSDHVRVENTTLHLWGTGNAITSDITRPAEFLVSNDSQPLRIEGHGAWRKILPLGTVKPTPDGVCGICWPCRKLAAMFPDFYHDKWKDDLDLFQGDARNVLQYCHSAQGIAWICHQLYCSDRFLLFLPSGRLYPTDDRRCSRSSSKIRDILENTAPEELPEKLKAMVPHPRLLLHILGREDAWPFARPVEPSYIFPCEHWKDWDWRRDAILDVDPININLAEADSGGTNVQDPCVNNSLGLIVRRGDPDALLREMVREDWRKGNSGLGPK
ncbi:hypothetical protein BDV96DRAFT_605964 [Lophiotrema nucula]|uniref:Cytidyltransferase-like domain-containing protein n=1 Tax=Lophiotrema nucula TaxID=690887 RepID=A0A6A5YMQ1_9PLEO|nr:hypothetical protein BDV96DRAFT_605964 [Lophiotrema nucula]